MSTLVGALVAGGLAPACTAEGIDAVDGSAETETTQSALKITNVGVVAAPVKTVQLPPTLQPLPPLPPPRQVCGKLVRIPSPELDGALAFLLGGTRIVYDTTATSEPLVGPYYYCTYPNDAALQAAIEECNRGPAQSKGLCLEQAHADHPQIKECTSTVKGYHSFIEFGSAAKLKGAEDMFFDSDTIRRVNKAGTFDIDINFVRATVTPSTIAAEFTKDPASDKAIANVTLNLTSNDPTVICQGGLPCPDVNLTNMKVHAQLTPIAPTADRTQLGFDTAVVTFLFDKNINNLPDPLVELFKDVDGLIRERVKKRLESALNQAGTHAALTDALTGLVEQFAGRQIATFHGAWFENGDLVVDYQPEGSLVVATGCMEATASP